MSERRRTDPLPLGGDEPFSKGLMARALALSNRMLPGPAADGGDEIKTGWESQSPVARSVLTRLTYQAAASNNEYRP